MLNFKMNKKGNVIILEFIIIIIIMTFFIFYPFAIYSSYQTRDVLEDVKDRGLQLVATTGKPTFSIIDSIAKEFEFYGILPSKGQKIVVTFYNSTKDIGEYGGETLNTGKKTVIEFVATDKKNVKWNIVHENMSKAYRKDQDIICMTIQCPTDEFLNSTLKLIGRNVNNKNQTGAKLALKVSGFIMSEYVD